MKNFSVLVYFAHVLYTFIQALKIHLLYDVECVDYTFFQHSQKQGVDFSSVRRRGRTIATEEIKPE